MEKRYFKLLYTALGVSFLIILVLIWQGFQLLDEVTEGGHTSLDAVVDSPNLSQKLRLTEKPDPKAYGFTTVKELQLSSLDATPLRGWWLPTEGASACVVFVHDRNGNRLTTLPFLEAVHQQREGMRNFQYLLPDLRNSGNSGKGDAFMGYHRAEDLLAFMLFVQQQSGVDRFVLYGFGTGAMAAVMTLCRDDLRAQLEGAGCKVVSLVLDSPMVNAYAHLERKSQENHRFFAATILATAQQFSNWQTDGFFKKMKLSTLEGQSLPVLVLQNLGDEQTPTDLLLLEVKNLQQSEVKLFDGEEHSGMFFNPKYKQQYLHTVGNFLASLPEK